MCQLSKSCQVHAIAAYRQRHVEFNLFLGDPSLPQSTLQPLQRAQKAPARLICDVPRREHIIPICASSLASGSLK